MSDKAVKAPNYTEEMVAELYKEYTENPTRETVDRLAEKFGKSPKSVIAKLCNLEIYVTPPRTTKSGAPVVKKEELVEAICSKLNIKAESLIKANKRDLAKVVKALSD